MRGLNRLVVLLAVVTGMSSTAAYACPRDGTSGPCRCVEKAMKGEILPGAWVGTPQSDSAVSALTAASAVPAPPADLAAAANTQTVHVFNFGFSPDPNGMNMNATINIGDTVHWVWDSGFHSVISVAGSVETFNSGDHSSPSFTFDHTFTHAGVFHYYCDIHGFDNGNGTASGMTGTITVVPEPAAAAMALPAIAWCVGRRRRV